jgi:hypothetical protein
MRRSTHALPNRRGLRRGRSDMVPYRRVRGGDHMVELALDAPFGFLTPAEDSLEHSVEGFERHHVANSRKLNADRPA